MWTTAGAHPFDCADDGCRVGIEQGGIVARAVASGRHCGGGLIEHPMQM